MKSPKIAAAATLAALSFAAVPAAMAATPHSGPAVVHKIDASKDRAGVRHTDPSPDRSSRDSFRDLRDR